MARRGATVPAPADRPAVVTGEPHRGRASRTASARGAAPEGAPALPADYVIARVGVAFELRHLIPTWDEGAQAYVQSGAYRQVGDPDGAHPLPMRFPTEVAAAKWLGEVLRTDSTAASRGGRSARRASGERPPRSSSLRPAAVVAAAPPLHRDRTRSHPAAGSPPRAITGARPTDQPPALVPTTSGRWQAADGTPPAARAAEHAAIPRGTADDASAAGPHGRVAAPRTRGARRGATAPSDETTAAAEPSLDPRRAPAGGVAHSGVRPAPVAPDESGVRAAPPVPPSVAAPTPAQRRGLAHIVGGLLGGKRRGTADSADSAAAPGQSTASQPGLFEH